MTVSKLDVGVLSGKLNEPPKSCIPNKAKMKMKRKRRKSKDMMDDKAFIRAITRFRSGDQYLQHLYDDPSVLTSEENHFTIIHDQQFDQYEIDYGL